MYKDMADAMGVDSKTEKPIDFDFSKQQYKNAAKTMVYNKFKNVNTKEELQKALNGLVGHKRLKSQLKELLYMAF